MKRTKIGSEQWLSTSGWLSVMLLLRILGYVYAEQRFAMQPQDQTAVVGSRVTLPCRVIDKNGMLQWTKDDFGLGTHRNLTGFDRYSMVGSDEEGDFSLDIFPVMLEDDARYQCQVSTGPKGEAAIRSEYATLSVLVPPEAPRISQGGVLTTTEDREIELECISAAGKPAAEITWIDGHGNVMTHGVENIIEELPDGRRFTVKSILKLTPKREHHNTTFTCQAQNTAERTHRAANIKLEVKYAPKVTVKILSGTASNGRILEGAEVHFGCSADANPPEVDFRWYLNDRLIVGDYTTEMVIHNITREHHDNIVKCEVHNPVGKSEESETLDVTYAPIFRTKPRSVQAEYGATVVLTCDVDSNPPAEIVWSHENSTPMSSHLRSKIITTTDSSYTLEQNKKVTPSKKTTNSKRKGGSNRNDRLRTEIPNTNLTLTVDPRTSGRYYCRASVPGFPEIGAEASVYLKGPPTIISHKTQFGIEGDNVRVECIAFSIPKPEHIIWSFNGKDVDSNDQDYSILEDPLPEGVKSTLIIRESQQKHFGMYNCSVANPYGVDVVEINLTPQKNAPWLIIGIICILAAIFVVTCACSICLYQRHSKKQPEVDSNTIEKQTQQSDRSSNISDLKLDLRGGGSVSNMDYTTGATTLGRCGDSDAGSENTTRGTTGGVPLAGPVPLSLDTEYRYSAEYVEPSFPPQKDGQNNNGYVPYVDYTRDYNPPPLLQPVLQSALDSSRESLQSTRLHLNSLQPNNQLNANSHTNLLTSQNSLLSSIHNSYPNAVALTDLNPSYVSNGSIDPRYSATYGNPYLRNSNVGLPPPNTAILAATPAPPPYTRDASRTLQNGAAPQVARLPNSPNGTHIVPTSNLASVKRGTLATHV